MGRTKTQLRQLIAQQFPGAFVSGTVEASGNSTSTLTDDDVLGKYEDNKFIGAWVLLTSGTPSADVLRGTDSDQGTAEVTFRPTLVAAPDGLTYEVLPFEPDEIHQALDQAIKQGYDQGLLVRPFEMIHFLSGSPIYNGAMEYWDSSSTLHGWTASADKITQTIHTSTSLPTLPGKSVMEIAADAVTVTLDYEYARVLAHLRDATVNVRMMAKTAVASKLRVQLMVDGSVVQSSSYHTGGGTWEVLSIENYAISVAAHNIQLRIDSGAEAAGQVGAVWVEGGHRVTEYEIPSALMPDGPTAVYAQPVHIDTTNLAITIRPEPQLALQHRFYKYRDGGTSIEHGILKLETTPPERYVLRMIGTAPLTLPTANTDIVEVDTPEDILLAKMAALIIVEPRAAGGNIKLQALANSLRFDIEELKGGKGTRDRTAVPLAPDF